MSDEKPKEEKKSMLLRMMDKLVFETKLPRQYAEVYQSGIIMSLLYEQFDPKVSEVFSNIVYQIARLCSLYEEKLDQYEEPIKSAYAIYLKTITDKINAKLDEMKKAQADTPKRKK